MKLLLLVMVGMLVFVAGCTQTEEVTPLTNEESEELAFDFLNQELDNLPIDDGNIESELLGPGLLDQ